MIEPDGTGLDWFASSLSYNEKVCVEVAVLPRGGVAVRDSKDPGGGVLTCAPAAWDALVRAARHDAFDPSA